MLKEYRTLLPYWRSHAALYLSGFFFLFITDAGQLYLPQLLKRVIDRLADGTVDLAFVARTMALMVVIAFLIALGRFGWRFFIIGSARRIERELRSSLFDHLLTLSSSFYGRNKVGDLMSRATSDIEHVRMASGMGFVALFDGLFMTVFIIFILFRQYPGIAPVVLAPFPLVTILVLGIGPFLGRFFKAVQEGYGALSTHVQEVLSGIKVIKSFNQEAHTIAVFREKNDEYKRRNLSLVKLWGFFFPLIGFLSGVVSLLLLRFGGAAVVGGQMTAGDLIAAFSYLGMLIWPMLGAGFTVNLIQRGGASLARINAVLHEKPDIASKPGAVSVPARGDIEVKDLCFTYPDAGEPSLVNVSVTVPAGTTLGILGRTGSGKSTLVKTLPRLLDPPRGAITINGKDIHEYDLSALRASIGMVPQETFLFSTSIRENIAFASPGATAADIDRAAEVSTIDRDLSSFPLGLETMVGERGITLSGGQKQRIAISRAVLAHPDILIFDDALSSVDTSTEERILSHFLSMRKGKTNILISHRVSTLMHADQIIVLDHGRVVQQGTHENLLVEDGFYQEIYLLQKLEEERS
ncbi:MAG: ABC transporter ATP-binding protein [Spirochaetales bacterium]|nr:ABC transporter ATP-binding protein [Spirochaetales bacterium]